MTVVCYTGWHVVFLVFASVGAVVYAIGIPLAVAHVTAFRSISHRDVDGKLACRSCHRRELAAYATRDVRSRFAFLYHGYATNRSGTVVAWESYVMLRKLAVALAGSLLQDPYLQILVALLVLVVSFGSTAFVLPYEMLWLNAIDVLGLFALIVTQILSIVYFYAETSEYPFMDAETLEILITGVLVVLNGVVLLLFFVCWVCEMLGVRAKCAAQRSIVLTVASAADVQAALITGGTGIKEGVFWHHPNGVAVSTPPVTNGSGVWVWQDAKRIVAASTSAPELLCLAPNGVASLSTGVHFRWMDVATRVLSAVEVKPPDVGGWAPCCSGEGPLERASSQRRGSLATEMVCVSGTKSEAAVATRWGGSTAKRSNPLAAAKDTETEVTVAPPQPRTISVRTTAPGDGTHRYVFSDFDGVVHGPFASAELIGWLDDEQLDADTPVAIASKHSTDVEGGEWTTLAALAAELAPFEDGV